MDQSWYRYWEILYFGAHEENEIDEYLNQHSDLIISDEKSILSEDYEGELPPYFEFYLYR